MRIKVIIKKGLQEFERKGKLVGLTYTPADKCMAVVQLEGDGMILRQFHPSEVVPIEPARPKASVKLDAIDKARANLEAVDIPPAVAPDTNIVSIASLSKGNGLVIDLVEETTGS